MNLTALNVISRTVSFYGNSLTQSSYLFVKCYYHNSFSNFFYTKSINTNIALKLCSFQNIINSAVIVDADEYGKVFSSPISSTSALMQVSHCQFKSISSGNPILFYQNSVGTLLVDNTLFYSCVSTGLAGGLHIEGSYKSSISNCCFRKCKAPARQAIWARYTAFFDFIMNTVSQCSPKDSKGENDGVSFSTIDYMKYYSINTTDCHVTVSSVSLQLVKINNSVLMYSSFVNNSDAYASNEGSIGMWEISNSTMSFNNYIGLVYSSYCISIDALSNISISDSVFRRNSKTKYINNVGILRIFSCFFDVSATIAGVNSPHNQYETIQSDIRLVHLNTFYCMGQFQAITHISPMNKIYNRYSLIFLVLTC